MRSIFLILVLVGTIVYYTLDNFVHVQKNMSGIQAIYASAQQIDFFGTTQKFDESNQNLFNFAQTQEDIDVSKALVKAQQAAIDNREYSNMAFVLNAQNLSVQFN